MNYGVEHGLPSNLVYSMAQDDQGFLWFATDKGLARFDGHRFQVFGTSEGLPDNEVFRIVHDSKGRLWLAPFQQNPCYWENGRIVTLRQRKLLEKTNFAGAGIDFQELPNGQLWMFGTSRFVFVLQDSTVSRVDFEDCPRKLFLSGGMQLCFGNDKVTRMFPDGRHEILLDYNREFNEPFYPTNFQGIDFSGNLILYSRNSTLILMEFDAGKVRILDIRKDIFGSVIAEEGGNFWVCNTSSGAYFVECSTGKIVLKNHILKGKKVNFMMMDRQHTRWFCTLDEGVYGLPIRTARSYTENIHLASGNIASLVFSGRNGILAGDDEGNIYRFKGNDIRTSRINKKTGYNRVLKMVVAPNDSLYAATDQGVYCYPGNNLGKGPLEAASISAPKSLMFHQNHLWATSASFAGFFYNGIDKFAELNKKRYTAICADAEGNVWAGGVAGLYSLRDSFKSNWGDRFPELAARIVSLEPAGPNYIWVVSSFSDLLRVAVSDGKVTGVEVMNKVLSPPIRNIKVLYNDNQSNLWMGTNHGVYMLRPNWTMVHYDKHDGIADDDINTLLVHGDTLWIGTTKGLTLMQLGQDDIGNSFPTYVTGYRYKSSDQTISAPVTADFGKRRELVLPADAGLVEIHLAGLDYASRGNIQYLASVEEVFPPWQWTTFGNLVSLMFSGNEIDSSLILENILNLGARVRPGKYVYRFAAINTRGNKSDQPDTLILIQKPFWYETCWFWLVIWTVVLLIFRKFYQDRLAYRDLTAAVSRLRLQALQAQMNPHFVGNSIYAIQQFFYPPDPEKASEYIELFNRLLRQSMLMSEKHFVRFVEDIRYYQDYLAMIHLRFGERFQYQLTGVEKIPGDTPFPAMVLQPIIENATIHGLAPQGISTLKMSFDKQDKIITCIIEDNGEGIDGTRENNRKKNIQRKSKGLEILHQKIHTMNRLYNIDIQLKITDLKHADPARPGTLAILTLDYRNLSYQELLAENQHEKD